MTKAKTTTEGQERKVKPTKAAKVEAVRSEALRRYGQAIINAAKEYQRALTVLTADAELTIKEIPPSEEEKKASAILTVLGFAFVDGDAHGGAIAYDKQQALERLYKSLKPHVDARTAGEAVELAESLVQRWCEMVPQIESGAPHPELPAPFKQAAAEMMLALELAAYVHSNFRVLRDHQVEVRVLLTRYVPSTGRAKPGRPAHNTPVGTPSKLTAKGILCELNKKADYPLGRLNVNGVESAIKRFRKTRIL